MKFTKKSFFYTKLGFTQPNLNFGNNPLAVCIQKLAGTYEIEKSIDITKIDNIHLKRDCIDGSIVNGIGKPILYSFVLDKPLRHKGSKTPRVYVFKKVNNSVFISYNILIRR